MSLLSIFRRPEPAPIDIDAIKREAAENATAVAMQAVASVLARRRGVAAYAMDNPQNYTSGQSPQVHPGSMVSVDFLRRVADLYDPLRACINHLKREVSAVPLKVVAIEDKDDSAATKKNIELATAFTANRGGLGGPGKRRSHFEGEVIEDLCVVGACAVYYDLPASLTTIDAETIKPLVDDSGHPPIDDSADAYQQWIQGHIAGTFSREDLYYDGIYPVSYSPYFKSPVEYLINCINSALRADDWNRKWLTDGNAPARLFGAPDDWTPAQIKDFQEYLDAMLSGDSAARQKAKIVPSGFKDMAQTRKDQDFQEFELWLLRRCCAIMGVTPASIGFAGEQYKVSQEGSQEVTTQFGVGVLLDFLTAFYDDLWLRMGLSGIRTQRATAKEEDAKERDMRHEIAIRSGKMSPNEARAESGLDPKPNADGLLIAGTMVGIEYAYAASDRGGGARGPQVSAYQADAQAAAEENQQTSPNSIKGGSDGKDNGAQVGQAQQKGSNQAGQQPKGQQAKGQVNAATSRALAQWERKALNRVRSGKSAACGFESAEIDVILSRAINRALSECVDAADVRAAFREPHVQRRQTTGDESTDEVDGDGIDELVSSIDSSQPVVNHANGKELGVLSAATIRAFWDAETDAERAPNGATHEPVAPFTWHPDTAQYVGRNARAASAESVKSAAEALNAKSQANMLLKANEVLNGKATASDLSTVMEQSIIHLHGANAALAVGGVNELKNSPAVLDWVGQRISSELAYKDNRIAAIEDGRYGDSPPLSPQLLQHVGLYGLAGRGTYVQAKLINARETLDHDEAMSIRAAVDSCAGCIEQEALGWQPIDDVVPVGMRDCLSNCYCEIVSRKSGDATDD